MKKTILPLLMFCLFLPAVFGQGNVKLAVGMKAPDWMFQDADKAEFTMNTWAGKAIQVNYVDPDVSDLNDTFNDAINKAVDIDKIISRDLFKGFGVVDCSKFADGSAVVEGIAVVKGGNVVVLNSSKLSGKLLKLS